MLTTTQRPKACASCGSTFLPFLPMARACSPTCALKLVRSEKKVEKVRLKERKEKVKTNGERKAGAQSAINHWVVHVRDADLPCISCGRHHQGANHAGHYRSRGSAPHLALDPRNLAKQCAPCNLYLHGNQIEYRKGLIARHGVEFVEALEADDEPRHYSGADYDAIKSEYRALTRAHKKEHP